MDDNIMLFDQFLVIGLDPQASQVPLPVFQTFGLKDLKVLSIFPRSQSLPGYLDNLKHWCFHYGFFLLDESFSPISPTNRKGISLGELEKIEQFVITDAMSIKRYCTSRLFYEKQYIKGGLKPSFSKVLPKTSLSRLVTNPLAVHKEEIEVVWVPKALVLVSRMPIFQLEAQFLSLLYEEVLYPQRESRNKKDLGLFEFYCSVLFSLLKISDQDQVVSLIGLDSSKELLRFQMNNSIGINVPSGDFWLLFERLGIDSILKVFSAILLEKQVIFFGKNSFELTNIMETLLGLICPLTWGCIYIPFLPIEMWETLHAMMPFLIGLDAGNKEDLFNKMGLTDKVIVDLIKGEVYNTEDIIFPVAIKNFLKKSLEGILSKKEKSLYNILKIKQAFLNAMCLVLNNIEGFFFKEQEILTNLMEFSPNLLASSEVFDLESFLRQFHEKTHYSFMNSLCMDTMMMNKFIEDCFCVLQSKRIGISFLEDTGFFLVMMRSIINSLTSTGCNPNSVIDIMKNPLIFNEIQEMQELQIKGLVQTFELNPPLTQNLLPFYLNYQTHRPKTLKQPLAEKKQCFEVNQRVLVLDLKALNQRMGLIPIVEELIDIIRPKSPTSHKKLEIAVRKKINLLRLASYENTDKREDKSPSSLISHIKHYYVYYHAIKRNQTFWKKRPTFSKNSIVKPFTLIEEKVKNSIGSEKKTPFFPELGLIELQKTDGSNKAYNPQDSSNDVTPNTPNIARNVEKYRKEPENFSKWLMDNSINNVKNLEKVKENFKGEEKVHKRIFTRSLSPKKTMKGRRKTLF